MNKLTKTLTNPSYDTPLELLSPQQAQQYFLGQINAPDTLSGSSHRRAIAAIDRADPAVVRDKHIRHIRLSVLGSGDPNHPSIMFRGFPSNQDINGEAVIQYWNELGHETMDKIRREYGEEEQEDGIGKR